MNLLRLTYTNPSDTSDRSRIFVFGDAPVTDAGRAELLRLHAPAERAPYAASGSIEVIDPATLDRADRYKLVGDLQRSVNEAREALTLLGESPDAAPPQA